MNVNQQRPGVYSSYTASSVTSGRTGGKAAAVVAACTKGTAGKVYTFTDGAQAAETFGAETVLGKMAAALFANGAGKVYAVRVSGADGYEAAFAALEKLDDVAAVVCDSDVAAVQQKLRQSVMTASENRRERLAVVCGGAEETATELVARAATLNSERVILAAPGGAETAAAVAGAIAGEADPAMPMSGVELKLSADLAETWSDSQIDALVLGGVTPVEQRGGVVSIVRAVTTRTKTGTAADPTWRELSTIRVVDDVIPAIRSALWAKFSRAKNTSQGRDAIRSQVIVELENKLRSEIISGYNNVTVTALEDDPTVCLVQFQFTVAYGLNQIWLSANITV